MRHLFCCIVAWAKKYRLWSMFIIKIPIGTFFAFMFISVCFTEFVDQHPISFLVVGIIIGVSVHLYCRYVDGTMRIPRWTFLKRTKQ